MTTAVTNDVTAPKNDSIDFLDVTYAAEPVVPHLFSFFCWTNKSKSYSWLEIIYLLSCYALYTNTENFATKFLSGFLLFATEWIMLGVQLYLIADRVSHPPLKQFSADPWCWTLRVTFPKQLWLNSYLQYKWCRFNQISLNTSTISILRLSDSRIYIYIEKKHINQCSAKRSLPFSFCRSSPLNVSFSLFSVEGYNKTNKSQYNVESCS
jgi:hypothetical protein